MQLNKLKSMPIGSMILIKEISIRRINMQDKKVGE